MGLDAYIEKHTPGNIIPPEEMYYWRKNSDVHKTMQRLAAEKGIISLNDGFNCVNLRIETEEELKLLKPYIETNDYYTILKEVLDGQLIIYWSWY
jgi:hypothetical protein